MIAFMSNDDLLARAFEKFDAANAQDPNQIDVDGVQQPKELVFAKRLTDWVTALQPSVCTRDHVTLVWVCSNTKPHPVHCHPATKTCSIPSSMD